MRFPLCIILAANSSTRIQSTEKAKCLLEVNGKPLLEHVARFWAQYADRFAVVVSSRYVEIAGVMDRLAMPYGLIWQPEPIGFSDAVYRCRDLIDGPFMVALADCLFKGQLHFPSNFSNGVAVQRGTSDWHRSYAVGVNGETVTGLIEKPALGLGAYFFDGDATRFQNNLAWETVLAGIPNLKIVPFEGEYLNCTYPEDLGRWQQGE